MKFTRRTCGIYEIIRPELAPRELLDSSLLKEKILELLKQKVLHFCVDLSQIDYIYSDALNVLISLNRAVIGQGGKLALLGPSPEVANILERTGIGNILRVFRETEEIESESREILRHFNPFFKKSKKKSPDLSGSTDPFQKICTEVEKALIPAAKTAKKKKA